MAKSAGSHSNVAARFEVARFVDARFVDARFDTSRPAGSGPEAWGEHNGCEVAAPDAPNDPGRTGTGYPKRPTRLAPKDNHSQAAVPSSRAAKHIGFRPTTNSRRSKRTQGRAQHPSLQATVLAEPRPPKWKLRWV